MDSHIDLTRRRLSHHPLFRELTSPEALRFFMESHVFAVWDFMSLLKRLQRDITCVSLPWRPSPYPQQLVRFINQIVVGEESDVDQFGVPMSHFALYLRAMEEVGADTTLIRAFLETPRLELVPHHVRPFVSFTLETALHGPLVEVAAAFFYGREQLIPGMFTGILETLPQDCSTLRYYLERHVQVDGEDHGPLSELCLQVLCEGDPSLHHQAEVAGLKALAQREALWDRTLVALTGSCIHAG